MNKLRVASKWGVIALAWTALVLGSSGSVQGQPEPDCGPNREWICVVPGCPECGEVFLDATVCEKNDFEQQTGRVCSPP